MSRHGPPPWAANNENSVFGFDNTTRPQYTADGKSWFRFGQGPDRNETEGGSGLFGRHHKPDAAKPSAFEQIRQAKLQARSARQPQSSGGGGKYAANDPFGRGKPKSDPFHRGKGK